MTAYPEIPAERNPETIEWRAALDNYEPVPRRWAGGTGTLFDTVSEDGRGLRIEDGLGELEWPRVNIVLDDGRSAVPLYFAGFHDGRPSPAYPEGHAPYALFLPFPVNPDGRTRPDNGRTIDYSGWALGPRKTFHLKMTRTHSAFGIARPAPIIEGIES